MKPIVHTPTNFLEYPRKRAKLLAMKLLVFAHTPPPHHGQSYMVKQMLEGFGGDQRGKSLPSPSPYGIACYHVNARLSRDLEDIGEWRLGKVLRVVWYCAQAVWCRFRYGVTTLYYVPAPGKRAAVFRDWLVMALCRPFYKKLVLHWHAAGLSRWLERDSFMWVRKRTFRALGRPDLSVILSDFNRTDADKLLSRAAIRVNYGIPDPCPDFDAAILPRRMARARARRQLLSGSAMAPESEPAGEDSPTFVRILYLANCMRTKGLFDAMDAVLLAQRELVTRATPLRLQLIVAGAFASEEEQREFQHRLTDPQAAELIQFIGFVSGARKDALLRQVDLTCFPTYYPNENQPVTLIESIAYGVPAVTTDWRCIPDIFPAGYVGIVKPKDVRAASSALLKLLTWEDHGALRRHFCERFVIHTHLNALATAIHSLEPSAPVSPLN
jgi:glycosyltransferase involved in cell wall biosynthesis